LIFKNLRISFYIVFFRLSTGYTVPAADPVTGKAMGETRSIL
jgi:hypothetical protein